MKSSDELNYEGLFSYEEISLVKREIKKWQAIKVSLKNYDFNDLLQEVCIYKLHPAKKKYGVLKKFLIVKITRNALKNILRKQKTQKERVNYMMRSIDEKIGEEILLQDVITDGTDFEKELFLKYDIDKKFGVLSKTQQKICKLLLKEYSQRKIAKILKKSRNTIADELNQIKNIFDENF